MREGREGREGRGGKGGEGRGVWRTYHGLDIDIVAHHKGIFSAQFQHDRGQVVSGSAGDHHACWHGMSWHNGINIMACHGIMAWRVM